MFATIVWATDGSETADRGLPYVKELATKFGAKVIAAHSEEFLMGPVPVGSRCSSTRKRCRSRSNGR